ncbi:DUF2076 domain-containing protein [Paracoccus aerius]|uniref:DUF2076 family protein n=1 Tax=Paracoccus aerius TaxID=1915382 RepID=A0ABS1SCS8_9RHOB|nr:DUF2076 family protein [Paracoccus aerius]MBL3675487.1 DUF2076 family protein [Paracoccus aerius]GHG34475.1 hypothetical protein GCM10017322_36720 [Paracoccus aerius]
MDHNDRQAIEGLFHKLGQAAQSQPHRDPEAEALIRDLIARNPGAAYYLAQTVIVQEQALNAAQDHIQQLQHQAQPQPPQGGGLFGRLFGGGQPQAPRPMVPRPQPAAYGQQPGYGQSPQGGTPWNSGRPSGGGGGFMAGAAQTAMGVAGGVLLGNAIGGMFAGPAEAAEAAVDEYMPEEDAGFEDGGYDDGGDEE